MMGGQHFMQSKFKNLLRMSERGDGATFGSAAYMPFLFFLMAFGLIIALLGFWRVSTTVANERAGYVASTTQNTGAAESQGESIWQQLTGASSTNTLETDAQQVDRAVTTSTSANRKSDIMFFGEVEQVVGSQSEKRWEQFYAGPASCADLDCRE
jgi:hypothetical protein